jgi:hypothetical protein
MKDRPHTLVALAFAAVVMTGCDPAEHAAVRGDARGGMAAGRAATAAWTAAVRPQTDPHAISGTASVRVTDSTAVIAVGYLERLRLGLGGPFRLVELALTDPRLDTATREQLGWALLAATLERRAYEIDPAALDRAGAPGLPAWPGLGKRHLELIEEAVRGAEDPRSGELAVRLAYTHRSRGAPARSRTGAE